MLVALIAGALFPLGFAPLDWWPVTLLAVSTLFWLTTDAPPRIAARMGFAFGLGMFGVGISWVAVSIHDFGHAPWWLAAFLTLLFVMILAAFIALMTWVDARLLARLPGLSRALLWPLLWLATELFRTHFLTNFPWLYLGYSQFEGLFAGLFPLLGIFGVTLLGALFCTLLVYGLGSAGKSRGVTLAGLLVLIVVGFGLGRVDWGRQPVAAEVSVALVQANVDQNEKWQRSAFTGIVDRYRALSEPYWGYDYIIWSEAAIPARFDQIGFLADAWRRRGREAGTTLISGFPVFEPDTDTWYASLISLGVTEHRYDKQELVPFGEYVPLQSVLRGMIEFFDLPMSSFTRGEATQKIFTTDKLKLTPAICYEIAFPGLVLDLARQGFEGAAGEGGPGATARPNVIVTVSNDAWFGASWGPLQHFQMVRTRALELGMPVLRATNNGITAILDRHGRVEKRLPQFERGVLASRQRLESAQTPYARYGFAGVWMLAVLLMAGALIGWRRHR